MWRIIYLSNETKQISNFRAQREALFFTSEMLRNTDRSEKVQISFTSQMVVTEQFWSYGFMSYIAETGGFVGLFTGFSLLQLEQVLQFCSTMFRSRKSS